MTRIALFLGTGVMLLASSAMGAIVAVCHVPPGNPANAHTVLVGPKAADAHLRNHSGDFLGFCPCRTDEDCDEGLVCDTSTGDCVDPTPDCFDIFEYANTGIAFFAACDETAGCPVACDGISAACNSCAIQGSFCDDCFEQAVRGCTNICPAD